jgi:hypothetical protein
MSLAHQVVLRIALLLTDGFPAVYRRFRPFYWARSGRKSAMNQPLGGFSAAKHRLKTAKTVAPLPHRIDGAVRPRFILL